MPTNPAALPRWQLAALAAPSIVLSAFALPLVVYLPEHYSSALGLDLAIVGAVFTAIRILDVVCDPLIGGWMDRTRSRFGRYKLWLAIGAPLIMIGVAMLFMARPGVGPAYLATFLIVAYAGWSIVSVSQLALAANLSSSAQERSRIYGWWQGGYYIGVISVMLLPKLLALLGHPGAKTAMTAMAILIVALTPLMIGATLRYVPERNLAAPVASHAHFRDYIGLLTDRAVARLLGAEMLLGLAGGVSATMAIFFFIGAVGVSRADIGIILICQFVGALLSTPVWVRVARRWGKSRTLMVGAAVQAMFQTTVVLLPQGEVLLAMLLMTGAGFATGAITLFPRAMMADCAADRREVDGADQAGLLFSMLLAVWKLGQAIPIGILFVLLSLIAYDPAPGARNDADAVMGLRLLFGLLPAVLSLGGALMMTGYPQRAR